MINASRQNQGAHFSDSGSLFQSHLYINVVIPFFYISTGSQVLIFFFLKKTL